MIELTVKQQVFVNEYLIDLNGRQAAIRAGYAPRSADQQAARLMANVKVRAYIDRALAERSRRTGVNADRVVRELARIAFLNPPDVVDAFDATIRDDATRDDTAAISSVKVKCIPTEDGVIVEREVKFADKVKALELLMKHLGMLGDRDKAGNSRAPGDHTETGVVILPEVDALPSEPIGGDENG